MLEPIAVRVQSKREAKELLTMLADKGMHRPWDTTEIESHVRYFFTQYTRGYVVLRPYHLLTLAYGCDTVMDLQEYIDTYLESYNEA